MISSVHPPLYSKRADKNNTKLQYKGNFTSGLPFKPSRDSFVSFGWSKNVTANSIQEKILEVISDPTNKTAVVVSHTFPDGDSYGSNIGVAGMLNSLGMKAFSVIDDQPKKLFSRMPSAVKDKTATSYVKTAAEIKKELASQNISQLDLAVITDCSLPDRTLATTKTGEKILDLATKAKKVIIIDHHPDLPDQPPNEQQWKQILSESGIKPENVLYWRESRTSAAEMVAELDKELNDEAKTGKLDRYKPDYTGYRLALASGMYSDASAIGKFADQVKFARLSEKPYRDETSNFGNVTRKIFDWLVNTCGILKSNINFIETTSVNIPDEIREKLDKIVDGTLKVDGINVKQPTPDDPVRFISFENFDALKIIADEVNAANIANGSYNKLDKINASDLYKEIYEMAKRLDGNNDLAINVIANKIKVDKGENYATVLSIVSYGYESLRGELYQDGHVFAHNAAKQILEDLEAANLGSGRGHDNAKGFKSVNNVGFENNLLPVIRDSLKRCTITRDIPAELQGKTVQLAANKEKKISMVA